MYTGGVPGVHKFNEKYIRNYSKEEEWPLKAAIHSHRDHNNNYTHTHTHTHNATTKKSMKTNHSNGLLHKSPTIRQLAMNWRCLLIEYKVGSP